MSTEMTTKNPFQQTSVPQSTGVQQTTEASRQMAEVQAAVIMAKRFQRDEYEAFNRVMKSCERISLAEQAVYSYPRGSTVVKGPSIRLAEAIAKAWGNLDFGIREIEQDGGNSVVQAYCWDLETNVREVREFNVPHVRHTRKGQYSLDDPRDIYELVANMGARRLRACILAIIPGDVVEKAVEQCQKTIAKGSGDPLEDRVRKMVKAFDSVGVTKDEIEEYLGHSVEQIVSEQIVDLTTIYRAIKDNYKMRTQFFGGGAEASDLNEKFSPDKTESEPESDDDDTPDEDDVTV